MEVLYIVSPPPLAVLTHSSRRSLSCANSDSSDRSKDRSTPLPYQPKTITQVSLPLSGSPASSRAARLIVSGGQHSVESCISESLTSRSKHGQGRRAVLSAGKERQAGRRGKVSTPNLVTKQNQSCNPADKKGRKAAAPQTRKEEKLQPRRQERKKSCSPAGKPQTDNKQTINNLCLTFNI